MAVNTSKLKGLIVERGTNQKDVAKAIGMDKSTFYRKMKQGGTFTIEEAKEITETVPLTDQEAIQIFFGDSVAKTLQNKSKQTS